MSRFAREVPVGPFGRAVETNKVPRPRKILARLEDVPLRSLWEFVESLAEAQFRFEMYRDGFVELEALGDQPDRRRHYLAQDQVNAFLRGLIMQELTRRGRGPRRHGAQGEPATRASVRRHETPPGPSPAPRRPRRSSRDTVPER